MRKTKICDRVWLQQLPGGGLTMRTCLHPRRHDGDTHLDERGSWKEPAKDDDHPLPDVLQAGVSHS